MTYFLHLNLADQPHSKWGTEKELGRRSRPEDWPGGGLAFGGNDRVNTYPQSNGGTHYFRKH